MAESSAALSLFICPHTSLLFWFVLSALMAFGFREQAPTNGRTLPVAADRQTVERTVTDITSAVGADKHSLSNQMLNRENDQQIN